MQVIMHYPREKHELNALGEKIAVIHGEYIYSYLNGLSCSKEQKIKIIEDIKHNHK